jgi:hypothetical protein
MMQKKRVYNRDGKPDLYISYFISNNKYRGTIFNDPTHNRPNVLLKNISGKNDIKFKDVTVDTNTAGKYNTFTSAFIDVNNDDLPDLVLSNDNGLIEILENKNGEKFKRHELTNIGLGNWMGLAAGDIDSDGDQDLFLTNLGEDLRRDKISQGDVKKGQFQVFKHALLRNDGNIKFVNVIDQKGDKELASGFGWGAMYEDLNYDGKIDLIFAENFMLHPLHWIFPGVGRFFTQNKEGNFKRNFNYQNPQFGQTPLFADINKDKIKDVIWVNNRGPTTAYINKSINNYINVKLPETTEFVNAKITLDDNKGNKQYREIVQGGLGFGSDSSNVVSFGLSNDIKVNKITVKTIYGKIYTVNKPKINSTLTLKQLK